MPLVPYAPLTAGIPPNRAEELTRSDSIPDGILMEYFVVTGASRGLGAALCRRILDRGDAVVGVARSDNAGLWEYAARGGAVDRFRYVRKDLAETRGLEDLYAPLLAMLEHDPPQGVHLINNAGLLEPVGPVESYDFGLLDRHIMTNLTAPMALSAAFLARIKPRKELAGCPMTIVNITSGAGEKPYYGRGPYCATKAGLEMFTRVMAAEQYHRESMVRAYAVRPGVVDTDMQAFSRRQPKEMIGDPERFRRLKREGRLTPPERAAESILRTIDDARIGSGDIVDLRELYPDEQGGASPTQ